MRACLDTGVPCCSSSTLCNFAYCYFFILESGWGECETNNLLKFLVAVFNRALSFNPKNRLVILLSFYATGEISLLGGTTSKLLDFQFFQKASALFKRGRPRLKTALSWQLYQLIHLVLANFTMAMFAWLFSLIHVYSVAIKRCVHCCSVSPQNRTVMVALPIDPSCSACIFHCSSLFCSQQLYPLTLLQ